MRSLSWKELEKEVRFAGIPRDPKWGEDGTAAREQAPCLVLKERVREGRSSQLGHRAASSRWI